jgi:hypothetical protein
MLSGDSEQACRDVAESLGITRYAARADAGRQSRRASERMEASGHRG